MGIEQLIATQAQRAAGPSPMQQLSDLQSLQGQKLQNQGQQQALTANADALDQGKKTRMLQFAASVGQQIKGEQDAQKKAQLYSAGLQFAKMNGHDMSALPPQYDERAQQFLDGAHLMINAPKEFEARLRSAGFNGNKTQSSKIYPDGTVIQSTGTGVRVLTAAGEELQGKAAMDAVTSAMNAEAQQEKSKYSSREEGKIEGQRDADKAGLEGEIAGSKETGKLVAQSELRPQIEASIAAAKQAVADSSKIKLEERSNNRALETYQTAMGSLVTAMGGTETGPIAGRLPAISADAQIAEGAIATMAPVLKSIFRTAGEGTFTDKDQEMLLAMVPTRKDHPEAIKAKVAAINAIVMMKLKQGGGTSTTSPASQSSSQTAAPKKEGGQIMIDGNGNKAMVYPDGTFEEIQ